MLYNVVLVSAAQQSESATSMHISPPSATCLPRPAPGSLILIIFVKILDAKDCSGLFGFFLVLVLAQKAPRMVDQESSKEGRNVEF